MLALWPTYAELDEFTFEVKEYVRSVVLEHLSDKFNIHILNVDILRHLTLASFKNQSSKVSYL